MSDNIKKYIYFLPYIMTKKIVTIAEGRRNWMHRCPNGKTSSVGSYKELETTQSPRLI